MRNIVLSLLLVLVLGTSAMAANIAIDGVIERGGYIIMSDATGVGVDINSTSAMDMTRWGLAVDRSIGSSTHGTLYGFIEIVSNVSYYQSGTVDAFPGFWIDTDANLATNSDNNNNWNGTPSDTTGDVRHAGCETLVEWGVNTGSGGEGYNFWGSNTNPVVIDNQGTSIDGLDVNGNPLTGAISSVAAAGRVFEFACDLAELNDDVMWKHSVYPGQVWVVGARACGHDGRPGDDWAGDLSFGTVDRGTMMQAVKGKGALVPNVPAAGGTAGEYNYDGTVNAGDIDLLLRCADAGIANALMDLDADADVDSNDATVLIETILSTKRGDANLDGKVTDLDAGKLGLNWQDSITKGDNPGWADADFNGDGMVTDLDAGLLGVNWQFGVPTPGVPEPATLTLLALGGVALLRRRK
jgi:hypothetical protein